jgi:hypothetical protein
MVARDLATLGRCFFAAPSRRKPLDAEPDCHLTVTPTCVWHSLLCVEELLRKVPNAPYGVAALVQRDCTQPAQDGHSWWVLITDGSAAERIKVSLSESTRVEAGEPVLDEDIEPTVEVAARSLTEYGQLVKPLPEEIFLTTDDFR